ncbi:MAG: glycosyltransferase [Candidatus Bathyarchaeia archaeon]
MNILVIPTNDWMRAPGHGHIDNIAEKLAEKGHNVYAWHFDIYRGERVKRTAKRVNLIKPRTLWVSDPAIFFAINALFQGPAMFKAIRELKIDVVINENILGGLIAFLVSSDSVLKVFDFSDYFPESASIYYEGSSQIMKKMVEGVTLAITKLNIKLSHVCLAVCRSLVNNVRSIDNKKSCYFLPNGVDITKHRSLSSEQISDKNIDQSCSIMAIMGVIDNWLDLITPLEATRLLSTKFPEIKTVIIGPWRKEEFRTYIESFVETSGLASRVEIVGYVSDQQLADYLGSACCCVMPYKTDSFSSIIRLPEKLFVYSAYGKPIISTPLPEVIALGSEHVFFYHNVHEFVRIASVMLSDEGMRRRLSLKALEFANKYDVSVLAETLEQILLKNLLELSARAR